MKKREKPRKFLWIIGSVLSLAALALVVPIPSPIVRSMLVALLLGFSLGSLSAAFGGWPKAVFGFAVGVVVVGCFSLPILLPDLLWRIVFILAINGYVAHRVLREYREKRRPAPKPEDGSSTDPDPTSFPGYGTRFLLVQSQSGSFFHLRREADEFRFHRIGSALKGIPAKTLELLALQGEAGIPPETKDLVLSASLFDSVNIRPQVLDPLVHRPALLVLVRSGRKTSYVVYGDLSSEVILSFFQGIPLSVESKKRKSSEPKRLLELSTEERMFLPLLKVIHLVLFLLTVLASTLFFLLPFTYRLLATSLILLPLFTFVLYARYPNLFIIEDANEKLRFIFPTGVDLVFPLLLPTAALGLRTLRDYQVHMTAAVGIGCGILFLSGLVFLASRTKDHRVSKALLFGIILAGYLPLSAIQINCTWDQNTPVRFHAIVTDRKIEGSSRSTSYRLTLELPDGRTMDFDVGKREYEVTSIGAKKIVAESTGVLGMTYEYLE